MVGLGSNRCHGRHGRPAAVLRAAVRALEAEGLELVKRSRLIETAPLGPSKRRFANAVLKAKWRGDPQQLLRLLQKTERDFGRRRARRWGERVLDLDLLAFGAARLRTPGLEIPHPRLHQRDFVLKPMAEVWPDWRHPRRQLTVRHMVARLARRHPVDNPAPTL